MADQPDTRISGDELHALRALLEKLACDETLENYELRYISEVLGVIEERIEKHHG